MEYLISNEESARVNALLAGQVDYAHDITPTTARTHADGGRMTVTRMPNSTMQSFAMKVDRPPFDNRLVREAVSHAVDRDAVIDGALFGFGEPIGSHYSRQDRAWVDLADRYPHDPERARALLAEAGYAEGFDVTLRLPPRPYARRSGEVIAEKA